jgi:hypothetical protein
MFDIVLEILWINFILFIWFETDAFIEYIKLLKMGRYFYINEFLEYKKNSNPKSNYLSFIRQKKTNFITKLISCIPCSLFWLSLIFCIIFNNIVLYPIIYMLSYISYKILKKYVY